LLASVDTYVEYVTAAKDYVSIVGGRGVTTILGCALKYDVHVTIGVDHASSILDIVLQSNIDLRVELLNEQIKRLS